MLASIALVSIAALCVHASSHSEAPGTAKGPRSDLTDVYLYQSAEDKTVLTMAVSGLQRSDAGPNYNPLDSNFVYQYHIDNDGDAREDISFQFVVGSKFINVALPITVGGVTTQVPIALVVFGNVAFDPSEQFKESLFQTNLNNVEYYSVRVLRGDDYSTRIDDGPFISLFNDPDQTKFVKPIDNVGRKSFGASVSNRQYDNYANSFVYSPENNRAVHVPGCNSPASLFVGPRRDPFSIHLGAVFDLINIPGGPHEGALLAGGVENDFIQDAKFNTLDCSSVVAFVLEVPTECLLERAVAGRERNKIIGGWASVNKLVHAGPGGKFHLVGEQTNRLGNPLINELFIGLGDKDKWSVAHPKNDASFLGYIARPVLPSFIASSFGLSVPLAGKDRIDLIAVLLQGLPGLTRPARPVVTADLLRLNTEVAPTPLAVQASLAVLNLDADGYPNGRRLGDDVVDIFLRVGMGFLCTSAFRGIVCGPTPPAGTGFDLGTLCPIMPIVCGEAPGQLPGSSVNEAQSLLFYTDRSPISAKSFGLSFPYLNTPVPGNLMGECWRDEEVERQFETNANCLEGVVRNGCNQFSADPSCTCVGSP